ncbi:MAG: TetR-family transcriptional regulator [Pseudonocardiales bacterium]|nr:TetR-family transcriptional regulator [Jatrophihabitantaceae bacterium]MCW2604715.1 TetR-family transcriptional regulator [Pseudonocardiales bacterium]
MPRSGVTVERLALAAAELADANGLAEVTVSAVARLVGVRPASVYSHLASADVLLDQVTLRALVELADRLAEQLSGRSGRDALIAFAEVHREYANSHPGRWQALQRRLGPEAAAGSAGPRIARSARAIMRDYGLTPDDETHAVRLLGSAVSGFIALEGGGSFDHSTPPASDSWVLVLNAVDSALRNWPTDSADRA